MSVAQAKEFVGMVQTSNNTNIRTLLDGITYQFARSAAAKPGLAPQTLQAISATKPTRGIGIPFGRIMRFLPEIPGPLAVFDLIPRIMYDTNHRNKVLWEDKHPGKHYGDRAGA